MPGHPHISRAIPALVSTNPDISRSGGDSDHPHADRRRRRNANYRLRNSDYSSQKQCSAKRGAREVHGHLPD
jgi:hypothetical protein